MGNKILFVAFIILVTILKVLGVGLHIGMVVSAAIIYVLGVSLGTIKWLIATLILENKCDPYPFLKNNEYDLKNLTREEPVYHKLKLESTKGLIALGRFEEAKDVLLSIDTYDILDNEGLKYTYYINLVKSMLETGDIIRAEELYKREISDYNPSLKHIKEALKLINAERLFFLGYYEESREKFNEILEGSINNMVKARVIFGLASISSKLGYEEEARAKYNEVSRIGNKLGVAEKARGILAG